MTLRAIPFVVLLAGCVEVPVESLCAKFIWNPSEKTIQMDMVAQNVGAGYFECEGSDADCVASITEASQSGNALDADFEGCLKREEQFEQRGNALDIRHLCVLPQDHPTLLSMGIHVEQYGKPGKEKSRIVVQHAPDITWLDLPKSTERRTIKVVDDEETVEEQITFALKHNVLSVSGVVPVDASVTPLFQTKPGIAKALQEKGVLKVVTP